MLKIWIFVWRQIQQILRRGDHFQFWVNIGFLNFLNKFYNKSLLKSKFRIYALIRYLKEKFISKTDKIMGI